MKCYLFIDDLRIPAPRPGYQLYVARTYDEAIRALEQQEFDLISFDHDLGEEKTGYDIAKYIVASNIKIKEGFKIHSANPVGRYNISQLLTHYGYRELSWKNKKFIL